MLQDREADISTLRSIGHGKGGHSLLGEDILGQWECKQVTKEDKVSLDNLIILGISNKKDQESGSQPCSKIVP